MAGEVISKYSSLNRTPIILSEIRPVEYPQQVTEPEVTVYNYNNVKVGVNLNVPGQSASLIDVPIANPTPGDSRGCTSGTLAITETNSSSIYLNQLRFTISKKDVNPGSRQDVYISDVEEGNIKPNGYFIQTGSMANILKKIEAMPPDAAGFSSLYTMLSNLPGAICEINRILNDPSTPNAVKAKLKDDLYYHGPRIWEILEKANERLDDENKIPIPKDFHMIIGPDTKTRALIAGANSSSSDPSIALRSFDI